MVMILALVGCATSLYVYAILAFVTSRPWRVALISLALVGVPVAFVFWFFHFITPSLG